MSRQNEAWPRGRNQGGRRARSEPHSLTLESFMSPRVKDVLRGGAAIGEQSSQPSRKKRITPTTVDLHTPSPQWRFQPPPKPSTEFSLVVEPTVPKFQPTDVVVETTMILDQEELTRLAYSMAVEIRDNRRLDALDLLDRSTGFTEVNIGLSFRNPSENAFFLFRLLADLDDVLRCLRSGVLISLAGNTAISKLVPAFQAKLMVVLGGTDGHPQRFHELSLPANGVSYRPDFDGRGGFVSERSFFTFKKQRDAFFRLHQTYLESRTAGDCSTSRNFAGSVELLLSQSKDAENYIHLADLFVSQLLIDLRNDDGDDASPRKGADAVRLRLLQERLVAPRDELTGDLSLDFRLNFYQAFIKIASSASFHEALTDAVLCAIHDLVEEEVVGGADADSENDEVVADELLKCLAVLGKVLGMAHYAPRAFEYPKSELKLMETYGRLRQWRRPSVAVNDCLVDAMKKGHTLQAVTWVTHSLRFMDPTTASDAHHQDVFRTLRGIYELLGASVGPCECECGHACQPRDILNLSKTGAFCVSIMISWLLTSVGFHGFPSNVSRNLLCSGCLPGKKGRIFVTPLGLFAAFTPWRRIDAHLRRLAVKLVERHAEVEKPVEMKRKITPLTKVPSVPKRTSIASLIQTRLEQDFFRNQPSGVRKIAEFSEEIAASTTIKKLRQNLLPQLKDEAYKNLCWEEADHFSLTAIATNLSVDIKKKLWNEGCAEIKAVVAKTVPALLLDAADEVKNTCVPIVVRAAAHRLFSSLQEIVSVQSIAQDLKKLQKQADRAPPVVPRMETPRKCPTRDCVEVDAMRVFDSAEDRDFSRARSAESDSMQPALSRPPSFVARDAGFRCEPVSDVDYQRFLGPIPCSPINERLLSDISDDGFPMCLADCVIFVKNCSRAVVRDQKVVVDVMMVTENVELFVKEVNPKMAARMAQLWLDFIVLHCLASPTVENPLLMKFVSVQGKILEISGETLRPFWVRYLVMLMRAADSGWANFEALMLSLLRANLINTENMETEVLSLLTHSWPPIMLRRLSGVLTRVSQCPQVKKQHNVELIDWVAWFCADEPDDFDF